MAGLNKCCFIGNLGKEPEVRALQDGREVCNITVGVSESWKDKATGERKQKTEWVRVVIWTEGLVKVAKNYLKKGSKVYIEGKMETRKWVDQSGAEKYSTEIVLNGFSATLVMLDGKGDSAPVQHHNTGAYQAPIAQDDGLDDDIPF